MISADFRPERAWWWNKDFPMGPQLVRFFQWWRDNCPGVYPATDALSDEELMREVARFEQRSAAE